MITPDARRGTVYPVICTELCGLGHALMRSKAIVMTAGGVHDLVRAARRSRARQPGGGGGTPASAIFTQNGCGACHTFKPIPARRRQGRPRLDNLQESAKAAGRISWRSSSSRSSTRMPYVAPGYQPGVMPRHVRHDDPGHADRTRSSPYIAQTPELERSTDDRDSRSTDIASTHNRPRPPRAAAAPDRHPPLHRARLVARALDDAARRLRRARARLPDPLGGALGSRSGTACRSSPSRRSRSRSAS